jgi:uncharacterized protein YggE
MNLRTIAIGAGLVIVAAIAAAALIGPRNSLSASDGSLPRIVTVSGIGEVKVRPDMATISSGVTSEGPTAQAALAKNNAAMKAVIEALKNSGVSEDDIQTSNFSVSPQYAPYQPGQTTAPRISFYQVSNQVTARVKKLEKLGSVLDSLVQAGSNQISGISFDINEQKPVLDEARKKAVSEAKAKAELYAEAAGASLGRVIQISESVTAMPMNVRFRAEMATADASVPIAAGQNTIAANITITYELQ